MSTNLPRITQKIFAQNAATNDLLQFGSVLSGSATPSTSIAETQTEAYQTGWRSAVISDRNYPTLGEMNAVQQVPTQQLAYLFQKGVPEWDASTTYFANVSYCQVNGVIYQSLTDNNIGHNPTTDNGTNWIIADFSNKLTNCILAAPNGVATYSGNSITLKAGLKGVIPNGRNADGTLNNIEYTVPEDITEEFSFTSTNKTVFLFAYGEENNGDIYSITYWLSEYYYEQDAEPFVPNGVQKGIWLDTLNNKFKLCNSANEWTETECFRIGELYLDNSSNISSFYTNQPVSLAKEQDIDGMWVFNKFELFSKKKLSENYDQTFDLSNYLPNDGNIYEIILSFMGRTADSVSSQFEIGYYTDIMTNFVYMMRNVTRTNSSVTACGSSLGIVGRGRTVRILQGSAASGTTGECACTILAYRKVR